MTMQHVPSSPRDLPREPCPQCGALTIVAPVVGHPKTIRVDDQPDPKGNVSIVPVGAMILPPDLADRARKIKAKLYRDHAQTCTKTESKR